VQTPFKQSVAARHAVPCAHFGQLAPPQSTSLSAPFVTLSLQVATRHVPPVQTPLEQSTAPRHALPSGQRLQALPPQSVSLSP
jgi:hypothetical protein